MRVHLRGAPGALGRWLIIGAVLLGLSACSAVRLGYNNGPSLALWQLDRWLDLSDEQKAALRPALDDWFAWHRANELPVYADRLAQWQAMAGRDVTGAEVCALTDEVRGWAWRAFDAIAPAAAARLPEMGEAQWRAAAARQADRLGDLRKDYLQPRPEDRRAAALDRAVERAEDLYGPLSAEQRQWLARSLARSPFDPERWIQERAERHRALLEGLQRAQRLALPARTAELKKLATAYFEPDGGGSATSGWRAAWRSHNCEATATLHNGTTPAQREHLRQRLAGWEEDLRALAAPSSS